MSGSSRFQSPRVTRRTRRGGRRIILQAGGWKGRGSPSCLSLSSKPLSPSSPCPRRYPSCRSAVCNPAPARRPHFLPLFLIPCVPVLRGPLPPALAAISLRAFSSVESVSRRPSLHLASSASASATCGRHRRGHNCQPVTVTAFWGWGLEPYRRASSRGRACRLRPSPWSTSWPASAAWLCRLGRVVQENKSRSKSLSAVESPPPLPPPRRSSGPARKGLGTGQSAKRAHTLAVGTSHGCQGRSFGFWQKAKSSKIGDASPESRGRRREASLPNKPPGWRLFWPLNRSVSVNAAAALLTPPAAYALGKHLTSSAIIAAFAHHLWAKILTTTSKTPPPALVSPSCRHIESPILLPLRPLHHPPPFTALLYPPLSPNLPCTSAFSQPSLSLSPISPIARLRLLPPLAPPAPLPAILSPTHTSFPGPATAALLISAHLLLLHLPLYLRCPPRLLIGPA